MLSEKPIGHNPKCDKSNILVLVALGAIALMLILTFVPWFKLSDSGLSISRVGITTWYGIFACIFTIVAAVGVLYNHRALAFGSAIICVIMAVIGLIVYPSLSHEGIPIEADVVKETAKNISHSRLGNIFFLIASLVTAGATFLLAKGKEIKK